MDDAEEDMPSFPIPCLRITDWPVLAQRGYMLDVSRNKVVCMSDATPRLNRGVHVGPHYGGVNAAGGPAYTVQVQSVAVVHGTHVRVLRS